MVLRRMAVVLLVAAGVAGCAKGASPDTLEISYTISGVTATETRSATSGGQWDKTIPNANARGQLQASVTVDRQKRGFMQCMITYQDSKGQVFIVDYVHDNSAGSITCRSDKAKVTDARQKTKPVTVAPPAGCGIPQDCPSPDSLNLNVTWFKSN